MKKLLNIRIVILLGFALLIPMNKTVAAEEVIDEFNGEPIIVLGEQLSDEQKEETRRLLNDKKDVATHEIIVTGQDRSEEHTSELQSRFDLVCRLLLENKI